MTPTTMTLERPVGENPNIPIPLIKQIIQLAKQPNPANVDRNANKKVSKFQQELASSEQTLEESLKDLSCDFDPEIERLVSILKTLDSPLEKETKSRVARKISQLKSKKEKCSKVLYRQHKSEKASAERKTRETTSVSNAMVALLPKYPFIKIKEIPWLDDKKNPQIIPMHESTPTFTMEIHCYNGRINSLGIKKWCSGSLHKHRKLISTMEKIFIPHIKTWKLSRCRQEDVETQHTFTGAIPLETKETMQNARPDFKDAKGCLLMLADARTLKFSRKRKKVQYIDPDPLIVGYHPDTPDLFWFVAAFDMTPIEALIMDKALKPFHERKLNKKKR